MNPLSEIGIDSAKYFQDLKIPKHWPALCLAPHPDDFDAIGVTLKALKQNGNKIHVMVLSSGASGVEDEFAGTSDEKAKSEIREKEQTRSCQYFGLAQGKLEFLRLKEDEAGHTLLSDNNTLAVRDRIDTLRPSLIFMPHWNDTNLGHQRSYSLLKKVANKLKLDYLVFLNRDPKTIEMNDNILVPFNETEAIWKGELLKCHDSQHQRNLRTRGKGFDYRILSVNRKIARDNKMTEGYAEAFEVECFVNGNLQ